MILKVILAGLLLGAFGVSPAGAAPPPVPRGTVAVCDPNAPSNCVAPTPAGGLPGNGGIYSATVTPSTVTIITAMTWQPLASAGQCQVLCMIFNLSVNDLYVCPFVATGTPTPTQTQECYTLPPGARLPTPSVGNAFSIASAEIADCPVNLVGKCTTSALLWTYD